MTRMIIWELLSLALLWTCFCRSVRTDKTTRLDVRLALWVLGLASLVCVGAPAYGWVPDSVVMMLLAAITLVQITTSVLWRRSVPRPFSSCPYLPYGRRCGDEP
jgi:hypothetical protein